MKYKVIYSDRKTVGMKVKNGELIVRAPRSLTKEQIEKILIKHSEWIAKAIAKEKTSRDKYASLTDADIKELSDNAKLYFEEKCRYYAQIMGVSYSQIKITGAKTRFGSCRSDGHICFSYRLMLYPEELREYVVVHELAHLFEMNHSKRFYKIVEKYIPDYKVRQKALKGK